jgi:butyryl-CoA dehydrogenase
MNFELTEEQQLIGQSARDFATEYLDPIVVELDRTGAFPAAIVQQLAAQDFLGLLLPAEMGGAGAGFLSYVQAIEALSRSCGAIASILTAHTLAGDAIARWGCDSQKAEYLPKLAKGEPIGAVAIMETGPTPGVGPNALIAVRKCGTWVLSGTKAFVRNAGAAGLYVVFATGQSPAGMTAFVVGADTPGLTVGPPLATMGLKGCAVAHLTFEDVALSDAAVLGPPGGGSAIANRLLAIGSVAEAAQTVGIGRAAVGHAAGYARQRAQFGHPVASFQAIQTLLADITTDVHLAWLGVQRTAQLIEDGNPFETDAAMVKAFLARVGSRMLIDSCQIEGGFGYSEAMPLPRLFRDIAGTTLLDAPADFPDQIIAESIA